VLLGICRTIEQADIYFDRLRTTIGKSVEKKREDFIICRCIRKKSVDKFINVVCVGAASRAKEHFNYDKLQLIHKKKKMARADAYEK
jgi:hypothetical protein